MKRPVQIALGALALAGGTLLYGSLVEARRLKVERHTLRLRHWPKSLEGFRIAFLADFHLRDTHTLDLAHRAVGAALDASPDMVVLGGDYVEHWTLECPEMLGTVLEPLLLMEGKVVAVPGNHDYERGDASLLEPIFDALNIKLLRNEAWTHNGIQWLGIDSATMGMDDAETAICQLEGHAPVIALWHEPDMVDELPTEASLMLSGHSHGGQFISPWGWAPMKTRGGKKYVRGFYPDAPTPIYVSRGLGTTGPPSRLFCPPEVTILTLTSS